jgi:hypothetical protein
MPEQPGNRLCYKLSAQDRDIAGRSTTPMADVSQSVS